MPIFTFKLEALLRHRERVRQEAERELATVLTEQAAAAAALGRTEKLVADALQDLRTNHLVGKIDLSFLAAHKRFMLATQRQGAERAAALAEVATRVASARAKVAAAATEVKIVEKLRENKHAEWRAGQGRKEMAALDEVSTQLAAAAMAGGPENLL